VQLVPCEKFLGSAGCQPAVAGSLPATDRVGTMLLMKSQKAFRQAAEKDRLAICALQTYTRERLRPLLRVYFTGRRLGSILVSPVPLFISMI
jgi:hypothetical protein